MFDCVIVTVNYKTPDLVCGLISSIVENIIDLEKIKMIVVDNGSNDDSRKKIDSFTQHENINFVSVIESSNNGFAGGNNKALSFCEKNNIRAKKYWFLNPDTRVKEGAYEALKKALEQPDVDAAGSKIYNFDGELQASSFRFPNIINECSSALKLSFFDKLFKDKLVVLPTSPEQQYVDWVSGASFMVTSNLISTVGMMDEEYFLYFEEVDYFYQAKNKGFRCVHVPDSKIEHIEAASTGIKSKNNGTAPRRPSYWFDSRTRFIKKNYGRLSLINYDLVFIFCYAFWLLRTKIFSPSKLHDEPEKFFRDFLMHSFLFKGL